MILKTSVVIIDAPQEEITGILLGTLSRNGIEGTEDEKNNLIRKVRNELLVKVEFVKTSDTLTEAEREAGLDYIQALKDIPQDFETPESVVFPMPPAYLEEWVNL